jgi:hypothetical protein
VCPCDAQLVQIQPSGAESHVVDLIFFYATLLITTGGPQYTSDTTAA